MKKVKLLIVGLGRVGGTFYQKFKEVAPEHIEILAISENNLENPLLKEVKKDGIPNYLDVIEAINSYGEEIDIIVDTSNNIEVKNTIRKLLQETNNRHTVLLPMIVYYLIWSLLPDTPLIEQDHHKNIGYS